MPGSSCASLCVLPLYIEPRKSAKQCSPSPASSKSSEEETSETSFLSESSGSPFLRQAKEPPVDAGAASESEGEDEWQVENIQDVGFDENGNEFFTVKWKGWAVSKGGLTVEPSSNLDNCSEKINAFLDSRKDLDDAQSVNYELNALRQLASREGCEINSERLSDSCCTGEWLITVCPPKTAPQIATEQQQRLAFFQDAIIVDCSRRNLPPITITNAVDCEGPPRGFTFILDYVYDKGVSHPSEHPAVGCKCVLGDCVFQRGHNCCPALNGGGSPDDPKFPYKPICDGGSPSSTNGSGACLRIRPGDVIIECWDQCLCASNPDRCGNRVIQKGHQIPMKILKTEDKGWGVFAGGHVPKGSFVSEYFGEVITLDESTKRASSWPYSSTLMIDLDFDDSDSCFVMDVSRYGNIARFINHSCDANLVMYPAYIGSQLFKIPRMALFARKNIYEGDELTLDYCGAAGSARNEMVNGPSHSKKYQHNVARHKCLCGTKKCKGFIY